MRAFPRVLAAFAAVVSIALVAVGCGSNSSSVDAARAGSASKTTQVATGTGGLAITAGRIGEATRQERNSALERLASGHKINPNAAQPTKRQRDGVGAGAACADQELAPDATNLAAVNASILCLLNGERTDRGLVALKPNDVLAKVAVLKSADMVAKQYFAHDNPDGTTMSDRIDASGYLKGTSDWAIGENLAWGTGALATPRGIMNAWMASQGHRENILNPRYREIGMGTVVGNPSSTDGAGATYSNEFGMTVSAAGTRAATTTTTTPSTTTKAKPRHRKHKRAHASRRHRRAHASRKHRHKHRATK